MYGVSVLFLLIDRPAAAFDVFFCFFRRLFPPEEIYKIRGLLLINNGVFGKWQRSR